VVFFSWMRRPKADSCLTFRQASSFPRLLGGFFSLTLFSWRSLTLLLLFAGFVNIPYLSAFFPPFGCRPFSCTLFLLDFLFCCLVLLSLFFPGPDAPTSFHRFPPGPGNRPTHFFFLQRSFHGVNLQSALFSFFPVPVKRTRIPNGELMTLFPTLHVPFVPRRFY